MHLFTLTILLCFSVCATSVKVVNYKFGDSHASTLNECINTAIAKFRKQTCIQFFHQPTAIDAISVVDSGYCSWRETNKTIHLGRNCFSENTCQRLLAQAITNENVYTQPIRQLNVKYCPDKCTINCQNGGLMTENCKCKCGYGLAGEHCEQLEMRSEFTDPSCGIRTSEDKERMISLSKYPNSAPKNTFCQWLIKANEQETIEFEFMDIDLNSENAVPGQKCADSLLVLGASGIENPIPCNGDQQSIVKRLYRSDEDWIMFTLSTHSWSRAHHKGPLIKYRIISPQSNKEIRSFSPYANSANSNTGRWIGSALMLFVWLKLIL